MILKYLRPAVASLVMSAMAMGSLAQPAKADTTTTLLITAAAVAALATGINVAEKSHKAHTVVGYLPNGSTVYADGHVVAPNGQSWYPGNYGENIACNGMQCYLTGPNGVGYASPFPPNAYPGYGGIAPSYYAQPYATLPASYGYTNGYGYGYPSPGFGYGYPSYPSGYSYPSYPGGYGYPSYGSGYPGMPSYGYGSDLATSLLGSLAFSMFGGMFGAGYGYPGGYGYGAGYGYPGYYGGYGYPGYGYPGYGYPGYGYPGYYGYGYPGYGYGYGYPGYPGYGYGYPGYPGNGGQSISPPPPPPPPARPPAPPPHKFPVVPPRVGGGSGLHERMYPGGLGSRPIVAGPVIRPIMRPIWGRPVMHPIAHPIAVHPVMHPINEHPIGIHPIVHPVIAPVAHPVDRPIEHPVTAPIEHPVTAPIARPVDRPIDRPVTAPIAHPLFHPALDRPSTDRQAPASPNKPDAPLFHAPAGQTAPVDRGMKAPAAPAAPEHMHKDRAKPPA